MGKYNRGRELLLVGRWVAEVGVVGEGMPELATQWLVYVALYGLRARQSLPSLANW